MERDPGRQGVVGLFSHARPGCNLEHASQPGRNAIYLRGGPSLLNGNGAFFGPIPEELDIFALQYGKGLCRLDLVKDVVR